MNKTRIMVCMAIFTFSGFAYAQKAANQGENLEGKSKIRIEELLSKAENSIENPDRLNDVIHEYINDSAKPHLAPAERREISKRFIKIFYSIDDSLTNMANKERIMEIVGFSDNSPEAHEFFMKILSSDNEKYREMALWGIRPRGVHGDDLYEKIESLERDGKISKIRSLQCLARANPARSLEEMKTILKTTQDVKEFVLVGVNLPEGIGDSPDVLDIIVDRYKDFKGKPASAEQVGYRPEDAISSKILWEHINIREGARLKIALEIMRAKGVCYDKDLPALERKTRSADKATRDAVLDFLDSQIVSGNLKREKVLPILKDAQNRESDQKLKHKFEKTIGKFDKPGGR